LIRNHILKMQILAKGRDKMKQILKIASIIVIFLLINLTFISVITSSLARAQEDEDEDPEKQKLQKTIFFLRKGKVLHPESPDPEDAPLMISCPAKTEPLHPILPGKYLRAFVWSAVPFNFESNRVNTPIELGHRVLFKLHFTSTQENIGTVRFRFTLLQSNSPIAKTDTAEYSNLAKDEDGMVTISAGINITGNRLSVGDTIDVHIDYWVNGDGLKIKYDNPIYDSGIEINMNPLRIHDLKATPTSLTAVFHEAFNVRLTKLNFITVVDETPITEVPTFSMTKDGRTASWKVDLKEGTHSVRISLSYGGNENETMVTLLQDIKIVIDRPPEFLGITYTNWYLIIFLIATAIIVGIIYKTWKSRREEQELLEMIIQ